MSESRSEPQCLDASFQMPGCAAGRLKEKIAALERELAQARAANAPRSAEGEPASGWVSVPRYYGRWMLAAYSAISKRLHDELRDRFFCGQPRQFTDNERQVLVAALATFRAALSAAPSSPASGWVKCSERLPQARVPVLFVAEYNGKPDISYGFKETDDPEGKLWLDMTSTDQDGDYIDVLTVTHWQPLPAAPESGRGE